jgi:uncharacterized protein (TIGR02186 family)
MRAALVLLLIVLGAGNASAERLITSLSTYRVLISSNFTGADLVLFGSVEREAGQPVFQGEYDIVAIVRGPRHMVVTRRKDQILGLWFNVGSRQFVDVPVFLHVLSNRPLEQLASADIRDRLQLGLTETVLPQRIGPDFADTVATDPFRVAFLRLQQSRGSYREMPQGVTFLTPTLFRATVPIPANITPGAYEVDVRVFGAGQVLAREIVPMEIIKVGFEEVVARNARDHGIFYGLFAAALAVMVGWAGAVIFRRD